ncbi:AraC family transcriptional regulator [Enterococcus sp. JM4C]|uniref:phosphoenolpyruvate hydrolase family protein n=1 Tax=Candidatus Enterococcus huntleyi TaxID=1857217 RepID=UPI00137981CB|nr:phosphoenolpyruvate hydrolase family protein [Enterococcus sp. JM4C]KAF1297542.1 AraC family transcriptional regulator [Enterococcus sp. JM4C]
MEKELVLSVLKRQIREGYYLLGVDTATGRNAMNAKNGGADLILALNSGKFRQLGRNPLAAYLPVANSNEFVREFSSRELLPVLGDFPVIFGVNATDPFMDSNELLTYLCDNHYAGVANYPSISLIDGHFREVLESGGITFTQELEFIQAAKDVGLFTIGFVTNTYEAEMMDTIEPDILCIHLGLTEGDSLNAKRVHSFKSMLTTIQQICTLMESKNSSSVLMIYGGPINDWIEVRYIYNKFPLVKGYIGGELFDQINSQQILSSQIELFKDPIHTQHTNLTIRIVEGIDKYSDPVDFVKEYTNENYSNLISMNELAEFVNLRPSYLSGLFKKRTGHNFTEYLVKFRLNKSIELMCSTNLQFDEIATLVGYPNYEQFSKTFKKYMKKSPKEFKESNITTLF